MEAANKQSNNKLCLFPILEFYIFLHLPTGVTCVVIDLQFRIFELKNVKQAILYELENIENDKCVDILDM